VQDSSVKTLLARVQGILFDAGSELATAAEHPKPRIFASHVSELEMAIDEYTRYMGGFSFVKSGESESSSRLHMARTVTRRAEREIVALADQEPVSPHLMVLINRISDLLYVLARFQANWDQVYSALMRCDGRLRLKEDGFMNNSRSWRERLTEVESSVMAYGDRMGKGFAVAIADASGGLQFFFRHPDTIPVSTGIAIDKAYTAAVVRLSTETVGQLSQPGEMLFGIGNASSGRIITFGGGIPLEIEGKVLGAVGVSGGTVAEDLGLAELIKKLLEEVVQNAG